MLPTGCEEVHPDDSNPDQKIQPVRVAMSSNIRLKSTHPAIITAGDNSQLRLRQSAAAQGKASSDASKLLESLHRLRNMDMVAEEVNKKSSTGSSSRECLDDRSSSEGEHDSGLSEDASESSSEVLSVPLLRLQPQ